MMTELTLAYPQRGEIAFERKKARHRNYIDGKAIYFVCKRGFDILFSLLFICLIMSWLTPLIILLIKIDSRGPVFFLQKRVGRGSRSFSCYKFRTMVVNNESDQKQASEDDGRITRIGRFLRKSNIDEFPQFLNILMGSMSIVGPRPHMHADCSKFSQALPEYKFRNMVKPGLTGIAQVKGYHGPTTDYESIFMRYQWDAFYVRNAGFLLDIRIIFRTALQRMGIVLLFFFNLILPPF